jgi:hypothetical protein
VKLLVLIAAVSVSSISFAKTKHVDFDRNTASSKTTVLNNHLSQAFQEAIKGSDQDLNSSKSSVVVEQNKRLANWTVKAKKQIVIQGTSAVDPATINSGEKIISKESQIDTEASLKNELRNMN